MAGKNGREVKPPSPIAITSFMLKQKGLTDEDICRLINRKSTKTIYSHIKAVQEYIMSEPEILNAKFLLETQAVGKSLGAINWLLDLRDPAAADSIRRAAEKVLTVVGLYPSEKRGVHAARDVHIYEDNRIITSLSCDIRVTPTRDEKIAEKGGAELDRFLKHIGVITDAETVDVGSGDQESTDS